MIDIREVIEKLRCVEKWAVAQRAASPAQTLRDTIEALSRHAEKRAPVQGYVQGIPWSMHLRAYNAYCKKWGAQPALVDLEGCNCRGGFGVEELDAFVPGWREELLEVTQLRASLAAVEAENARLRAQAARDNHAGAVQRRYVESNSAVDVLGECHIKSADEPPVADGEMSASERPRDCRSPTDET